MKDNILQEMAMFPENQNVGCVAISDLSDRDEDAEVSLQPKKQ